MVDPDAELRRMLAGEVREVLSPLEPLVQGFLRADQRVVGVPEPAVRAERQQTDLVGGAAALLRVLLVVAV